MNARGEAGPRGAKEKKEIKMEQNKINQPKAAESFAMTYGMSDELRQSDLLSRISGLSISDKQCLIRYISEEVETDHIEEDEWDQQDTAGLQPYTLDELYARIQESEEQYQRGEYYTEDQVRKELKEEMAYSWFSRTSP